MAIKLGNLDISSFKVGSADCKVYLGETLLYSGGTTPTPPSPTPTAFTEVNADNQFDISTPIYGISASYTENGTTANLSDGNGTNYMYDYYLTQEHDWDADVDYYVENATLYIESGGTYSEITGVTNSSLIDTYALLNKALYLTYIPVTSNCLSYECMQWDEETGDCLYEDCVDWDTSYPINVKVEDN